MEKLKAGLQIKVCGKVETFWIAIAIEDTPPEAREMLREIFNARLVNYLPPEDDSFDVKRKEKACVSKYPRTRQALGRIEARLNFFQGKVAVTRQTTSLLKESSYFLKPKE